MNKETREIVKALEAQGFEVRTTKKGHLVVTLDGTRITTLSGTGSDPRGLRNGLAHLRRAGFRWPT